jgi:hypothetical protein
MRFSPRPPKAAIAPTGISRREFAQAAALAAASLAPAPGPLAGSAQTVANAPGKSAAQSSPDTLGLSAAQKQEVEAKLSNIVRKYGARLSTEQRDHLRHILGYNEKMLASIRSVPLENGDPPATVFKLESGQSLNEVTQVPGPLPAASQEEENATGA